ncbi:MAG: Ig-like domain-containing protein [Syntrophales bacterium]
MRKLFSGLKMNILLLLALSFIAGCGTGGLADAPASGTGTGTGTGTTGQGSITFAIVKSSDPAVSTTSISPDSPAIIKATAKDSTGAVIAGKVMTFSSKFDIKFSPVSGTVLTNSSGLAEITIMVGATSGAATITASITDNGGTAIANDTGITVTLAVPPTVPTGVTATVVSSSQIGLAWTAVTGAAGYKIYKGGVLSAAVTTASSVEAGLLASTQYCYAISAYDGSGSESDKSSTVCATTAAVVGQGTAVPYSIDLLVSSPQLNSDMAGTSTVTLTAIVKDKDNRAMADQAVTFSADSGVLTSISLKTDVNGMATAKIGNNGDPTYRMVNLTAVSGAKTATNTIAVTGTQISIDPTPFAMSFNDSAGKVLTISLKDSAGKGIKGKTIALSSLTGKSTFSAVSYVTGDSGQITVTVKNATDTVGDTITATAIGVSSQSAFTINTAKLVVNAPVASAKVPINTAQAFTVTYTKNGIPPVPEQTVYFTTTRGTLTASSRTTVGGVATVNVTSTNSGPAALTAYTIDGATQVSIQAPMVFVANTATKMTLSASPAVINTNAPGMTSEQSLIKAIVRDASDNLVMGKAVDFSIIQDASAGALTTASATTDMYGMASTYYVAGSVTGGLNNVMVKATVQDTSAVTATTTLTVGGQALFISLATGPTIQKVEPNKYQKDYVALVTDAGGRPVANAVVTATATPQYYMKGYYYLCETVLSTGALVVDHWCQMKTLVPSRSTAPSVPACANEDGILQNSLYDYNGVLDPGEDQNANSRLDPGNVASVTAAPTDSAGQSTVSLVYARDYAWWVNVRLEVRANLAGTTISAFQNLDLPALAADYTNITIYPPGNPSPFGSNTTCYAALSVIYLDPTRISLNWDPSAYASSYNIYRDKNESTPVAVKIQNVTRTTYEDIVTAGSTYCYEIKQVNSSGIESPLSPTGNRVCVGSQAVAPASVTATTLSPTQIQVSWDDAGAASYRIYRDGAPLQYSVTRSIISTNLAANTLYCYAVASVTSSGNESTKSSTVCATTQLMTAPLSPTGLSVSAATSSQINLSWTAPLGGAAGYKIYVNGTYLKSVTTSPVSDTGLSANTSYCYGVSAYDAANNESAQTLQLCATTYGVPPADPGNLTTFVELPAKVILNWSASIGATGYYIYRNGVKIATVSTGTATTYTDTGAVANSQNIYRVTAVDATGSESSGSLNQVTVNTALTVPTMSSASADTSTQITIGWMNVGAGTGVAGYTIYRNGVAVQTIPSAATLTYADSALSASTQYCYRVSAIDASFPVKESAQSSVSLCATTLAPPTPTYIDLLVSNPQLNSDGASTVTLTALVKDSSNRAMANQTVAFSATSGLVTVTSATTNASGAATATLGIGADKSNRPITLRAATGIISATNNVNVVGTTITVSGQSSMVLNDSTALTISLKDSAGNGITNKQIDVSSLYNTVNNQAPTTITTITTDTNGQGTVTLKATDTLARTDTITAASVAMGTTGTFSVSVTANVSFTFTLPLAPGKDNIAINTNEPIEISYTTALGAPINGVTVYFATSRGSLSASSAVTGAVTSGKAKGVTVSSNNPGTAILTAFVTGGPSAQVTVEFVATSPAKMTLQADPPVIGTNVSGSTTQKSAIVAVVRDAEDNLVKNKTVNFTLATDPSVGYLSPVSATTDSFGTATTTYFSGATPSGANGVVINAAVAATAVTASTNLTVAQKPLFITLGARNALADVLPTFYQQDFGILITDAAGNPVNGAAVTASVTPVVYMKGNYSWVAVSPAHWGQTNLSLLASRHLPAGYPWPTAPGGFSCSNEDLFYYNDSTHPSYLLNGYLDPLEDGNGNSKLDPGGVASVTSSVTTGANGTGTLSVVYDKKYGSWVIVRLDVRVIVAGTEGSAYEVFTLSTSSTDVMATTAPPFWTSPFGTSATCSDDL